MTDLELAHSYLRDALSLLRSELPYGPHSFGTAAVARFERYFASRNAKLEWYDSMRPGVIHLLDAKKNALAWVAPHPRGGHLWSAHVGAAIVDSSPQPLALPEAKAEAEKAVRKLLLEGGTP